MIANKQNTAVRSSQGFAWEDCYMTGKGDEPSTTDGLQYPMVDMFTGGTMLPLMFINAAAAWYLLSLNAPLAFLEAWSDAP